MELAALLQQITPAMLANFFTQTTIGRGQAYVGQVGQIASSGMTLSGKVQGSDRLPYSTTVILSSQQGQTELFRAAHCTCPVGRFCKHAVALILAAQAQGLRSQPRQQILEWARNLGERATAAGKTDSSSARKESILYVISCNSRWSRAELRLCKAALTADGLPRGKTTHWDNYENALLKPPSFVCDEDLPIFRRMLALGRHAYTFGFTALQGADGAELLAAVLATGRAMLAESDSVNAFQALAPLQPASARRGWLIWKRDALGTLPALVCEPDSAWIIPATVPPYFIDAGRGEAGEIRLDLDRTAQQALSAILELPPLSDIELPLVTAAIETVAPALATPAPKQVLPVIAAPLRAVLRLETTESRWGMNAFRKYPAAYRAVRFDFALPAFQYDAVSFKPGDSTDLARLPDGGHARIRRDTEAEEAAMAALRKAGFLSAAKLRFYDHSALPAGAQALASEAVWLDFFDKIAPKLRAAGWQVEYPQDFRHHVLEVTQWDAELSEGENGWFDLALGIEVDGQKLALAPLLSGLFRREPRWLDKEALQQIDDAEKVSLITTEGLRIHLESGRIKPLASAMIDLFDSIPPGQAELRVSAFDAERVNTALTGWQTRGLAPLEQWQDKLRGMHAVQPVAEPPGFGLTLRAYQREGLAWLQHLRQHGLAGILADDMGLGKTAQTLAHILTEKQAGRLEKPVLVVLPTSLIFNWQREAERFAPDLKVLKLQGPDRHVQFAHMTEHDVCLTTYPLLARDQEVLSAQEYHSLILDEAQTVKNAASKAAGVIRQIRARHRLCLTGTPLENHLGELWALFDFLMPGFLGDARDFNSRWRNPIEKHGNALRRELLARRIAPFILRRRKDEVAKELPPKTVVLRTVELEGRQRDLYETVRSAMDKRVREEIASKGFARSQIIILDALLKLRQICCDPRLLKMDAASKVKERAKLDLLMDMLPELVEEGRKVLLFSQFTSMLDLIQTELAKTGIGYSLLTGQTVDRESAIRDFQEGDKPVFLISLKAGGVGLNLTAADTVIHFDPWWNPAAENQATDRAHRIGQKRKVFVYKLVVAGSIEEKILALQEKKAELAAGILSEDHEGMSKFSEDDLRNLLAPLPDTGRSASRR